MLRALYECGIVPDLIVGTSVGAITSAFTARPQTVETADELGKMWPRSPARGRCFGCVR
jgi:NTE family protein